MILSEIKNALENLTEVSFVLPNGEPVPQHFHVTEVGMIEKHFIECGGTVRKESVINFQLFTAEDFDHRLSAQKLKSIIELSEKELKLPNLEIEVEYQNNTIGKYYLEFANAKFNLLNTQTDCLAKDKCGIPTSKPKVKLADFQLQSSLYTAESACC